MNKQTIHGYICRDKRGFLMFFTGKPERDTAYQCWVLGQENDICCDVPRELFPEITWETEPKECEITIKLK